MDAAKVEEGRTAGIITGKSQRSAFDFFEKIETNFLEKYLLYLFKDEVGPKYFEYNEQDHQLLLQGFRALNAFTFSDLLQSFEDLLRSVDSTRARDPVVMRLYKNPVAQRDENVQVEELTYIYTRIKITNQKLKEIGQELQRKLQMQRELRAYPKKIVNVLIFYTGDVNFRFQKDAILSQSEITLLDKTFTLRCQCNYVSKVALFNHFAKSNNLNIDQVDDKTITLFELKRMSLQRRQQAIKRIQQEKEQKEQRMLQASHSHAALTHPTTPNQMSSSARFASGGSQTPHHTTLSRQNSTTKQQQQQQQQLQQQQLQQQQQQQAAANPISPVYRRTTVHVSQGVSQEQHPNFYASQQAVNQRQPLTPRRVGVGAPTATTPMIQQQQQQQQQQQRSAMAASSSTGNLRVPGGVNVPHQGTETPFKQKLLTLTFFLGFSAGVPFFLKNLVHSAAAN